MEKNIDIFKDANILVIGDIMLDNYYEGDAHRISPEAPVPVVYVEKKRSLLGGAGNVAKNITSLGASCDIIAIAGNDEAGKKIELAIKDAGIKNNLSISTHRQTTVKSRIFARNQQMLRFDEEDVSPIDDSEKKYVFDIIRKVLQDSTKKKYNPIIIISDYGKGLVYESLIDDIFTIADEIDIQKPKIIIDPKPQNKKFYKNAHCITPNLKEASELAKIPSYNDKDIIRIGKKIQDDLNIENVLITLGAKGMALFTKDKISHIKSTAKQVFDVTGAGDTVIATLASCIAQNMNLEEACKLATLAAGIVVEKVGSASITVQELKNERENTNVSIENW